LTPKGATPLPDLRFAPGDTLLLGRESAGVPDAVHDAADSRVVIPVAAGARSLNVAIAAGIAGIYAPVAYEGKLYPVDPESMAKYELAKQSRTRGKLTKGIAIATDGSVTKLSNTAAIDAFHAAMEDAITARVAAIHDAI
jgi:hypothetical protein